VSVPAARIETNRLLIRRFSKRDTAALNDAIRVSLADLNEWLPWARTNYQSGDAGAFIRDSLQAWKDAHWVAAALFAGDFAGGIEAHLVACA
jgi:hypothetical protein